MSYKELESKLTYAAISQISSIPSLLIECGAKNITDRGDYFSFSSPFREDKNPSAVLYKQNLVVVDFGGDISGSFSYFFYQCTGQSLAKFLDLDYKSFLDKSYFIAKDESVRAIDFDSKKEFRIKGGQIQYDFSKNLEAQSFIRRRFLSKEFIMQFQIGYCTNIKACRAPISSFRNPELKFTSFRNRLCIPIYLNHELFSMEGRDFTGTAKNKVLYPKGGGSVSHLFNYDNLDRKQPLVVVEGILDMPRIWQHITKNVTATFGINLTSNQKKQLNEFDHVILFSDTDQPGRNMISSFDTFMEKPFWVARLKEGDPGDSFNSIEELDKTIREAKEYTEFILDESELFETTDLEENYFENT